MDRVLQDFRYGSRSLLRSPVLSLVAVLTIGLGAGANATVFSFVDALLFKPVAGVEDASKLVAVYTSDFSSGRYGTSSYPDFMSVAEGATAFKALAAYADNPGAIVTINGATERINHAAVTANFFDVIGSRPAAGRYFAPFDAAPDAPPAVIVSYSLWTRMLGSSHAAIGTPMTFGGRTYTVIGVASPRFVGLDFNRARDIWTLLNPPSPAPEARGSRTINIIGRLQNGATLQDAQTEVTTIAARLAAAYPATNLGTLDQPDRPRPMTVAWHTRINPQFRSQVTMIAGVIVAASLLVLLTACANVGNLLLARGASRAREIAVRLAVGARRRDILRQLTFESLLLGVGGGVAGLLLALWTSDVLPSFFPPEQVALLDARVDLRVLTFCLVLSGAAGVIFGLAPALQSLKPSSSAVLRETATSASDSRVARRLRRGFVVVQVALAFVLLIGTGLLVRSLRNVLEADLGFGTREAVIVSIDLPPEFGPERGLAEYGRMLDRIGALAEVEDVAVTTTAPLSRGSRRGFSVDSYRPRTGEDMEFPINIVSADYFAAMQIPVMAGRAFDDRDRDSTTPVVMVNKVFADRYFAGNALGRRVRDSHETELQIVGVVGPTALLSPQAPRLPVVYYPLTQSYTRSVRLIARARVDATALVDKVVSEVRSASSGAAVFRPTTMKGQLDEALAGDRLTASLVSACGVLALALATVGVYGVVAYSVARRRREIGVRIALGASAQHVSALVLKEGLGLTILGVSVGAILSPAAATAIQSMLYQVSPIDLRTFAAVPILLCGIAVVAAWIPMRRAVRTDPVAVLRQE